MWKTYPHLKNQGRVRQENLVDNLSKKLEKWKKKERNSKKGKERTFAFGVFHSKIVDSIKVLLFMR